MAEEKTNYWAIAGYVAGGLVTLAGLVMGIVWGFDSTAWWTLGTGVAVIVLGLLYQFGILLPESK